MWDSREMSLGIGMLHRGVSLCSCAGDCGYPLLPYLWAPYAEDITVLIACYNWAHRYTHIVVEQVFGHLKMRFR